MPPLADRVRDGRRCYTSRVRRLALAIVVAILAFSASGAEGLFCAEPCTPYEQSQSRDTACPPTCVTCGCCALAVEATAAPETDPSLVGAMALCLPLISPLPASDPGDILHVPRLRSA